MKHQRQRARPAFEMSVEDFLARRCVRLLQTQHGSIVITREGINAVGDKAQQAPQTFEEIYERWKPRLNAGARRMIDALLEHDGGQLDRSSLAAASGIDQNKSTFRAALGAIKTAGLVVEEGGLLRLAR